MRHCLDFLRQSLMCCGDSGIEKVDQELKVSGLISSLVR